MKTSPRHGLLLFASAGFTFGCAGAIDQGATTQSAPAIQPVLCAMAPPNIAAWWPAEGNGTDLSGSNVTALQAVSFGPGEVGQAFSFNGSVAAQVSVAAPNFETQNTGFTIEGWVNPRSLGSCSANQCGTIAHRESNLASRTWFLGLDGASIRFVLFLQRPSVGRADVTGPPLATIGSFQHVAASYDGNSIRLYYNGSLAQTTVVGPANFNTGDPINIGIESLRDTGPLLPFNGFIDELSIYNRALSDQEVTSIFSVGSAGKCHPGMAVDGGTDGGSGHGTDAGFGHHHDDGENRHDRDQGDDDDHRPRWDPQVERN